VSKSEANILQASCYQPAPEFCDIRNLVSDTANPQISALIIPKMKQMRSKTITLARVDCSYQSGNKVRFLPVDLFKRFLEHSVEISEFEVSSCFDLEKLFGSELSDAEHLRKLKISNTNLQHIDQSSFEKLINVYSLDLSSNKIGGLEENVFMNLNKMSYLDLSNNNLRCFPGNLLKHNVILRHLQLQNNNLEFIEIPLEIGKGLRYANFEYNKCMSKTFVSSYGSFDDFVSQKCYEQTDECTNMLEVVPLYKEDKYFLYSL
jgi:Leucine-rich repeat (LRR) protein